MKELEETYQAWESNKAQRVPEHTLQQLIEYRDNGVPPGDFLYKVLTNDLIGAFSKADDLNIANMFSIASWVYNDMPTAAYGNEQKIKDWIEYHRINKK